MGVKKDERMSQINLGMNQANILQLLQSINISSTKMPLPEIVSGERYNMCYHMVYEIQVKSPNMRKLALKRRSFGLSFEMKKARRLEKLETGRYTMCDEC